MFFDNPEKLLKNISNIIGKLAPPSTSDEYESDSPYCNIFDYIDKYVILVELPGYPKDAISIDIKNDILTIKVKESFIDKDYKDCILKEIKSPHNPKILTLPVTVIDSSPIVKYDAGILRLEFPKIIKATKNILID